RGDRPRGHGGPHLAARVPGGHPRHGDGGVARRRAHLRRPHAGERRPLEDQRLPPPRRRHRPRRAGPRVRELVHRGLRHPARPALRGLRGRPPLRSGPTPAHLGHLHPRQRAHGGGSGGARGDGGGVVDRGAAAHPASLHGRRRAHPEPDPRALARHQGLRPGRGGRGRRPLPGGLARGAIPVPHDGRPARAASGDPMKPRRMLGRAVLAAILAVIWAWGVPTAAGAHAIILESTPAAGSTGPAPARLVLRFNSRLEKSLCSVELVGAGRRAIALLRLEPDAPPDTLAYPLPPALAPGAYQARWKVMAADGHVTEGAVAFTVVAS